LTASIARSGLGDHVRRRFTGVLDRLEVLSLFADTRDVTRPVIAPF
jgi:hypothetical protein